MNDEIPELVKDLPKINDVVASERADIDDNTANTVFDILSKDKDTTAMGSLYDTQSKESIDLMDLTQLQGLPVMQTLSYEDVLIGVENDLTTLMQNSSAESCE